VQEINIKGLQSNLKGKAKVQMLKEDIGIDVLDKIYNQKYKQYIYYVATLTWSSVGVKPNT
jgi:hypothetical protein